MKQKVTIEIICFQLVFLFVYGSMSKLSDFKTFEGDIYKQPFSIFEKPIFVLSTLFTELLISYFLISEKSLWRHTVFQCGIHRLI